MKPFNLEAAKAGAPLVTRDGQPVKFIAHVEEAHPTQRLLVLFGEDVYMTFEDGRRLGSGAESGFDLFMAPTKRTITLTVNGREWVLPAPLRGDEACDFWYFSELGSIKRGFEVSAYYDEIRSLLKHNGGGLYASKEDAQAWADFNKWCRGGGE